MKIIIKKLQGGEFILEVGPETFILELKQQICDKLGIPVDNQKLLLFGRPLADEKTLQAYPTIKEGTKLNLVVKKPDGLFETCIKHYKRYGYSDAEATRAANEIVKIIQRKIDNMSWDDIERLSFSCMNIRNRNSMKTA